MSGSRLFVLGVDLDGCVADFYAGLRPIAAEWLGVPEDSLTLEVSYGLPEWKLNQETYADLHRFAVTQRDLFRKLEPIEGAAPALRRVSELGIRVRIITHRLYIPYVHEQTIAQTTRWLDHYGVPYWDLCFMKDKGAVGADLYIEDAPDNVKQLRAEDNEVVIFTNSTNKHLEGLRANSWAEVERIAAEKRGEWIAARADSNGVG